MDERPLPLELGVGEHNRKRGSGQEGAAVSEGTETQLIPRLPPKDNGEMQRVKGALHPPILVLEGKRAAAGGSQLTPTLF